MCDQPCFARSRVRRRSRTHLVALILLALLSSACGNPAASSPTPNVPAPSGTERITNGGFESGAEGWTASSPESEGIEAIAPAVGPDAAHAGANGARFATQPGTTAISAFEQEFAPAEDFTFSFWMRPQQGNSRIGLAADGRRSNTNVSRLVFLNAGGDSSQIVFTAWDVNYVITYPLDTNTWMLMRVVVDGKRGTQTLRINDNYVVTVSASQGNRPAALALVLGDRQPRNDAYTITNTNARVTDGLNGIYDYDDISLIGP